MAGVTASIEPPFRLVADSAFKAALQRQTTLHGYRGSLQPLIDMVLASGSIQNSDLSAPIKKIFKTALELSPEEHLRMTAAFQQHIDEGIAKTVNLPRWATVADVAEVFRSAYDRKSEASLSTAMAPASISLKHYLRTINFAAPELLVKRGATWLEPGTDGL